MPIPSYPENRREEYLNNIATGSGEIPPYPENREEQYLDAIAKNGGGGGGSGGGVLVVGLDMQTGVLDKTWQEIHDADFAVLKFDNEGTTVCPLRNVEDAGDEWDVSFVAFGPNGAGTVFFGIADSANGYPVMQGD